jgi:asparagine synthase (glutamine-hydrolysing)
LNGDGGDELLGGYPRYSLSASALWLSGLFGELSPPRFLADLAPRLVAAKTVPQRAARKVLTQYVNPELRSIMMYGEFWNDPESRELMPSGQPELLREWRRTWLEGAFACADNAVDRMLWLDNRTYLPGDLLVKMDIASMHCGLETRSPLLDHKVIEFCARLPVRYKVKGQVGKYLLKKLAERYFPAHFVHRRKMGFGIPVAAWLRGPLRKVLREMLLDPRLMSPLSGTVIERTLREFDSGRDGHESRLWALLMFGCWRTQEANDRLVPADGATNPARVSRPSEC